MTRLKCTTLISMELGQAQLGDFVGSIFKKTNKLLSIQENFDLLDDMKHHLHRRYLTVVDFAVCEVFWVRYRKAFEEYHYDEGVKLGDCAWFSRSDMHRIDDSLCLLIPEGVKIAKTTKDYPGILDHWRIKMGTKWAYDGAPPPVTVKKSETVTPKKPAGEGKGLHGPTGRKRFYVK